MSAPPTRRTWTIAEAAAVTGLPATTLRYYESVGVVGPVSRGETSHHRVYDEDDLDQLLRVACLAATGMGVADMRDYVARGRLGWEAAEDQIALLTQQERRLTQEAALLRLRRRYVRIKIDYWRAAADGDAERAAALSAQADALAADLTGAPRQAP